MCGIIGYIGKRRAAPVLLDGLKKLEYRGYDSAGIALLNEGKFTLSRKKGRVAELERAARDAIGEIGIGHTRWATHGEPSERNAHPHVCGKFAVVHNGIIENYRELKGECERLGESFSSDTDTEVIAHLLARYYEKGKFFEAVRKALARLRGSYALAILCSDFPDTMIAARKASPLIVGTRADEIFVSSDIPALASEGLTYYPLADGETAVLSSGKAVFFDESGKEIEKKGMEFEGGAEAPELGGYPHFMRKEIAEIPAAIFETTAKYLSESTDKELYRVLCQTEYIQIVACGTAYHSGIAAKYVIEALARIPVEVCVASEYRYRNPVIGNHSLVIAVSQSGETADTLAAARLAKERGAALAAIVNVPYSSLTQLADFLIPTVAGTEIGVAATKSYNAQLCALYLLAVTLCEAKKGGTFCDSAESVNPSECEAAADFRKRTESAGSSEKDLHADDDKKLRDRESFVGGKERNGMLCGHVSDSALKSADNGKENIPTCNRNALIEAIRRLPELCEKAIAASERTKEWAGKFSVARSVYFIGRGCDYGAAIEGSLKLKEISYLPSEGYPAGELKHGTLALIGKGTPVVAVITDLALAEKTMNAVHEVISRGADAYLVTSLPEYAARSEFKDSVLLPPCDSLFSPAVSVIPLQMLAYHTALACGNDPDKPRNLAKSVTVE